MARNLILDKDFEQLDKTMWRQKTIRLADVQDRVEKVAFDVVRFRDTDGLDKLWRVEQTDEGDVLVAMYNDDEKEQLEVRSSWAVISDRSSANVNLFYKGEPVTKLSLASFGIPKEDASIVCRALYKKLSNDKSYVAKLLNNLSKADRIALVAKYPELSV